MRGVLALALLTGGIYLGYAVLTGKTVLGIGALGALSTPTAGSSIPKDYFPGPATTVTYGGGGHPTSH